MKKIKISCGIAMERSTVRRHGTVFFLWDVEKLSKKQKQKKMD